MKTLIHISALVALTIAMSCSKTISDDKNDFNSKTKKTDFTQFGDYITETLTVDLNQKTPSVKTNQKTQINVPNNAFQSPKGETVVGHVSLVIREIRRPSYMLLTDKPAMTTEGGILESYGEFYVSAFQNGEPLQLRDNMALTISTPVFNKENPRDMPLWEADTSIKRAYSGLNHNADRLTVQQPITKISGATWRTNGQKASINDQRMMTFELPKLNTWFNCDVLQPLETDDLTTVLVYFNQNYTPSLSNDHFDTQPSAVFFKPNGFNGLVKFYNPILTNEVGKQGFHSYENAMPVGMSGKLLAFTVHNGRYFVDLKEVTITRPELGKRFTSFVVNPIEVNKSTFLSLVQSLDN